MSQRRVHEVAVPGEFRRSIEHDPGAVVRQEELHPDRARADPQAHEIPTTCPVEGERGVVLVLAHADALGFDDVGAVEHEIDGRTYENRVLVERLR